MDRKRLVVVGGGMAAVAAVEEILALRSDLSITLFGDEPYPSYNRILLSEVLAGRQPREGIFLNPPEWYASNRIDLKLGRRVVAIDPTEKAVVDETGQRTSYDRLVLAMGGRPVLPSIQGAEKPGVFVFRTLEDCDAIVRQGRTRKDAVIVGGGLLGLEAARALTNYGLRVTVVHLAGWLMEQQLDPVGGAMLKREVERLGIAVVLGTTATEIAGPGESIEEVRLKDGRTLPAQFIVLCTGYRPNIELAQAAGLSTSRGVVVDDRLQTSDPNIYAVGDVIEHRGKVYGLVAPIREQAKVVALALTEKGNPSYAGTACATVLKVAGIHLTSAGCLGGDGVYEELVFLDTHAGIYKKLVFQQNRLVGMILLGDNREGQRFFNFIRSGEDLSALRDRLIAQGAMPLDPSQAGTAALSDADLVCNCHAVTKGTILATVRAQGLRSRGEVAAATKASTGCGSCASLVEDVVREAVSKTASPAPKQAPTNPSLPVIRSEPIRVGIPLPYPKVFEAERIKQEGLGLDWERIRDRGALALNQDDYYRLKGYGVCSQKHTGYFMVRIRIPGGRVTWRQLRVLADLVETHGRDWGHLTTRQDLELHWVRLEEVPDIWKRLDEVGLTTRSACGHTLRNIACCPHGSVSPDAPIDMQPWAKAVTEHFVERSDLINPTLPNRLNIFFGGCTACAPEAQINDLGFVPVTRTIDGVSQVGLEVWVGGSLGNHPILGYKIQDFLRLDDLLAACQSIFQLHIQYGNRGKGKSRLKFLVERWGMDKFAQQFERVLAEKRALPENRDFPQRVAEAATSGWKKASRTSRFLARLAPSGAPGRASSGALAQRQRNFMQLTVEIPLGEIRSEQLRLIARVCRGYANGEAYFTQAQDIELHWVRNDRLERVRGILREKGNLFLRGDRRVPRVLACPGTEFCILAVTNAQGAGRDLREGIRSEDPAVQELLSGLSIHISGCPNSCAKHQVADIGLAGSLSALGEERRFSYFLYLGGGTEGEVRLGEVVRKGITEEMVVPTLNALLALVSEHRINRESFREVINRIGGKEIGRQLEQRILSFIPQPTARVNLVLDPLSGAEAQKVC